MVSCVYICRVGVVVGVVGCDAFLGDEWRTREGGSGATERESTYCTLSVESTYCSTVEYVL